MNPLSSSKITSILSLLDSGLSVRQIASSMHVSIGSVSNIIKKHRPDAPKSVGGCKRKSTDADLQHATCLITSGKVETAVEACKVLEDITGKTLNPQTVRRSKEVGMQSVGRTNRPFLSNRHRKERMEFAIAHKDWTVEDWKRVI